MFRTAGFTFSSRLLSAALSFGIIVAVSRLLGPEERGHCALYLVIIALIAGISDIAGGAASSFLLKTYTIHQLQKVQMLWTWIPAICIPAIFYIFKTITGLETLILVFAGWVHCSWIMQQHLLLGLHQFNRINIVNVLVPALALICFLVFYKIGWHQRLAYLTAISLAWFAAFLSGFIYIENYKSAPDTSDNPLSIHEIFRVGFSNQISHLLSIINSRLVFFILPAASLGLWSNSLTLAEAMFLIPGSLGQVMYALESKNTDASNTTSYFRNAWWGNLAGSSMGLFVLWLLPENFWIFIFGKSFEGIRSLIVSIVPGVFLFSFYLVISYRQSASGYFIQNFKALFGGLLINLGYSGYFYFTGTYTLEIAIEGLILSWALSALVSFILLKRNFPNEVKMMLKFPDLKNIFTIMIKK